MALGVTTNGSAAGRVATSPLRTPFFTSGGPLRSARFQRKPPELVYSGNGAAFVAGRRGPTSSLRWIGWGMRTAVVNGDDWRNNCKPYCAAGTYRGYPVRVRLYRRRHMAGRPVFTRVAITYLRTPYPPGIHSSRVTYKFLCGHTGCQDRFWYGPY
jgi:hypothetical protein